VWLPLHDLALLNTSAAVQKRDHRWLFVLGRLKPNVSVSEVQARVDTALAAMANEWPDTHRQAGARFRLLREGNSERRGLTTAAAIAMGIIGLVLLLACFNVTNLLLARAVERERDLGLRMALGAGAQALDENVSMLSVKTMEQRMAVQLWPFRTAGWLFSICGILACLLATVGLASVVIHAVNRRLREFGVRMAMGATRGDLVSEVLGSSAGLLLPGLLIGDLLAAAVARLIQAAFVGVDVLNPLTYLAVALLEFVVVGVACLGPALRASRVDPMVALRAE